MRARDIFLALLIILAGSSITAARQGKFSDLEQEVRSLADLFQRNGVLEIGDGWYSENGWTRVDAPEQTFPAEGISRLVIANRSGDVRIYGEDTDEIRIEGERWGTGDSHEEILKHARAVQLKVSPQGGRLLISGAGPKNYWNNSCIDLSIHVPTRLAADIEVQGGVVSVNDLFGGTKAANTHGEITIYGGAFAQASSTSGNIKIAGIRGPVVARTTSGKLALYDDYGAVRAGSVSGDLEIGDVRGPFSALTVSGNINLQSYAGDRAALKTTNGNITVQMHEPFRGSFVANSVSGDILLTLPSNSDCAVSLLSPGGSIRADLSLRLRDQASGRLQGKLGGGTGQVSLKSTTGNLELNSNGDEAEEDHEI